MMRFLWFHRGGLFPICSESISEITNMKLLWSLLLVQVFSESSEYGDLRASWWHVIIASPVTERLLREPVKTVPVKSKSHFTYLTTIMAPWALQHPGTWSGFLILVGSYTVQRTAGCRVWVNLLASTVRNQTLTWCAFFSFYIILLDKGNEDAKM